MPQIYALALADNKGQAERKSNVTAQQWSVTFPQRPLPVSELFFHWLSNNYLTQCLEHWLQSLALGLK